MIEDAEGRPVDPYEIRSRQDARCAHRDLRGVRTREMAAGWRGPPHRGDADDGGSRDTRHGAGRPRAGHHLPHDRARARARQASPHLAGGHGGARAHGVHRRDDGHAAQKSRIHHGENRGGRAHRLPGGRGAAFGRCPRLRGQPARASAAQQPGQAGRRRRHRTRSPVRGARHGAEIVLHVVERARLGRDARTISRITSLRRSRRRLRSARACSSARTTCPSWRADF